MTRPSRVPGTAPVPGMSPGHHHHVAGHNATGRGTATPSGSPAPTEPESEFDKNFFIHNFKAGGPIMWPILVVSITALAVVLETNLLVARPLDAPRSETHREGLHRHRSG